MGTLFVDKLDPQSGTSLELGSSGDTVSLGSGVTAGTGFGISGWSSSSNNLLPASASSGIYLGVNSATASNLLNDYEEGTWTPTFSNYGGTDQVASGEYTKIGELVVAGGRIGTDGSSDSSVMAIAGLPFTISNSPAINGHGGLLINYTNSSQAMRAQTVNNTNYVEFTDASGSSVNYNDFGANKEIRFTIIYKA
tara:strand:+ start:48997 stop:49581 length:585 start_codon:yes stop_codon:yes gene_type:complete